ncbi:MAG: ABC transporter ATP-binding protein [Thermomicrobiales bacterium]
MSEVTLPVTHPAIHVADLTKRYGSVRALADVSFDIAGQESVALWGPNGAGKTTVLRCLLGLARYDGTVRIDGIDPARHGQQARARIGYVPQDLPVAPMSVAEVTDYVARLKRASLAEGEARLSQLGIAAESDKAVGALSGGMRQRLSLALALIGSPSVLLLDEPTANLDARGRADLLQLLKRLKGEGLTLVFSSHRPEDILALADRVLLLDQGRLVNELTPAAFMRGLGETSRMVLFLRNGHVNEALHALVDYTVERTADGKVLTVAVQPHQKAEVLERLAKAGVDLEDFDVERLLWTT